MGTERYLRARAVEVQPVDPFGFFLELVGCLVEDSREASIETSVCEPTTVRRLLT